MTSKDHLRMSKKIEQQTIKIVVVNGKVINVENMPKNYIYEVNYKESSG